MGTVVSRALGVAVIAASAACCDSGDFVEVAVVEDTTTGTTAPATVTDLSVMAVGQDSVTLQWTQVDDGTGAPADYALRYGSPTLDWGSVGEPQQGYVTGTTIGQTTTYTFTALNSDTDYEFGLVSYRESSTGGSVYGGLSNFVAATTETTAGAASLKISPSSVTLGEVGDAATLSVEARDDSGQLVSNPVVSWTSSDTTIATVNGNGMVTARAFGAAVIAASSVCCGDATTDLQVGQDELHPNEPAGFVKIYHNTGAVADLSTEGWSLDEGSGGTFWPDNVSSIADAANPTGHNADNPVGSGYVLNVHKPGGPPKAGSYGGNASVGSFDEINGVDASLAAVDEIYVSERIFLTSGTPDNDFQHGQKLFYIGIENEGSNKFFVTWEANAVMSVTIQGISNGFDKPYTDVWTTERRNAWVQVEVWVKAESSQEAGDGEFKIWVDGTLVAHETGIYTSDIATNSGPRLSGFEWYQNNDGVNDSHLEHSYQLGELYISGQINK